MMDMVEWMPIAARIAGVEAGQRGAVAAIVREIGVSKATIMRAQSSGVATPSMVRAIEKAPSSSILPRIDSVAGRWIVSAPSERREGVHTESVAVHLGHPGVTYYCAADEMGDTIIERCDWHGETPTSDVQSEIIAEARRRASSEMQEQSFRIADNQIAAHRRRQLLRRGVESQQGDEMTSAEIVEAVDSRAGVDFENARRDLDEQIAEIHRDDRSTGMSFSLGRKVGALEERRAAAIRYEAHAMEDVDRAALVRTVIGRNLARSGTTRRG